MKNNRSFDDVVQDIEQAEKNVDSVLKAARLERHEKTALDSEAKFYLLVLLIAVLGLVCIAGFAVLGVWLKNKGVDINVHGEYSKIIYSRGIY